MLEDQQAALFAALGSLGLLVFADIGGSPRTRLRAHLVMIACASVLVAIGTLVSEDTALAAILTFVVAFVVSFAAIGGRNFATGGNALILFFVVACGVPAADDALGPRLVGLLIAGALSTAAALLLWPDHPGRDFRRTLGEAADRLADVAALLPLAGEAGPPELTARLAAARSAVATAKPGLAATGDRPASPTAVDIAQTSLAHGVERIEELLGRMARDPRPGSAAGHAAADEALTTAVARSLRECGAALRRRGGAPAADAMLAARQAFKEGSASGLADVLASGGPGEGGVQDVALRFATEADRSFAGRELATAVTLAVAQTRVAVGAASSLEETSLPGPAGGFATMSRSRRWLLRIRHNLTSDSVALRNSLRLAAGLAAARAVAGAFGLSHGFWVVFATLAVMRTSAYRTGATVVQALAGTVVGFALASAIVFTVEGDALVYEILLPFLVFAAAYGGAMNVVLGQAGFTTFIVIVFNLIKPVGWTVGLVRVEDVAIGAVIGLVIGLAVWPRGATGQLGKALATMLDAGSAYVRATAQGLLGLGGEQAPASREQAVAAARRADDVYTVYRGEGAAGPAAEDPYARILVRGHGLWYSSDLMGDFPSFEQPKGCPHLAETLDGLADRLDGGYREMASALRSGSPPPASPPRVAARELGPVADACVRALAGTPDEDERRAAVGLFWVRAWLAELSGALQRVESAVQRVDSGSARR